jgi:beta-1,4-mannosyl-glycoprotein beta-1,4-N-acetylglucosaminyltransferase
MFYNELNLLLYRLHVLRDVVDYVVLVESTHTHVGKEKKLYFEENKSMFAEFLDKIIHVVVDDFPHQYPNINCASETWVNENFHRNCIERGIQRLALADTDVLVITDLDEIPDPETLGRIHSGEIPVSVHILNMDMYYYNLNTRFNEAWTCAKIISYQKYKELNVGCNAVRHMSVNSVILKGGWHLSYFGDAQFIQNKIQQFAHQELNHAVFTDIANIEQRMKRQTDLYDRPLNIEKVDIQNNTYLPPEYDVYLNSFVKST